ncbi:MAG TPA: AAA family ATPase [Candidatus Saccharimonadales bacterium]
MKLIIVNGLPATGKTLLSSQLSKSLDIPKIGKDDIKEFLFDKLGVRDREWSRSLGMASNDILYQLTDTLLSRDESLIVENAFEYQFAKPKFEKLIDKYNPEVYEIYCLTDKDVRRKRFVDRNESGERHVGHNDVFNYVSEDEAEPQEKYDILQVGQLIKVDTTDFSTVFIESIVRSLNQV